MHLPLWIQHSSWLESCIWLIAQHREGLFVCFMTVSQSLVRESNMTVVGQTHPEDRNLLSILCKSPARMPPQTALKEKLYLSLGAVSEWEEEERNAWQVPALPRMSSGSGTATLCQVRWISWTKATSPCSLACLHKIQLFLCLLVLY